MKVFFLLIICSTLFFYSMGADPKKDKGQYKEKEYNEVFKLYFNACKSHFSSKTEFHECLKKERRSLSSAQEILLDKMIINLKKK